MAGARYIKEPLDSTSSLWTVRSGNSRMGVVDTGNGKVCLISPLAAVPADAFSEYKITHLLAPNHYHNKALSGYSESFPAAQLCCSEAAKPRLEEVTELSFKSLTAISKNLPDGFDFLTPDGLKTGEIWIKFPMTRGCGWLVVDAFSGKKMSSKNHECNTPELLGTFPSYGIADKAVYKKWVLAQIKKDKPTTIIPCHGSIIRNTKLPQLLNSLIKSL